MTLRLKGYVKLPRQPSFVLLECCVHVQFLLGEMTQGRMEPSEPSSRNDLGCSAIFLELESIVFFLHVTISMLTFLQVKLAYTDKLNASAYTPMIKTLARSLQVNVNYQKLKTVTEKRFEAARSMNKLISNIHPATLFAVKQFYEPYMDDIRRIFSLYS